MRFRFGHSNIFTACCRRSYVAVVGIHRLTNVTDIYILKQNIGNVLPLQWAQLTETVHTARLGHEFVFVLFWLHHLSLCSCVFCFTLVS